jgi:ribosomal-protein-alanine N-acetyltransferase
MFSNPEVTRYWNRLPYTELAEARQLMERAQEGLRNRSAYQWAVARAEDDALIGTCSLFHIDESNRRAEIGYALDRGAWGFGYMNEALVAVVAHAFETLGLHRLEADADPRNAASVRSLERLGFRLEGTLRERWQVGGEISDSAFFGLLRPEWRSRA